MILKLIKFNKKCKDFFLQEINNNNYFNSDKIYFVPKLNNDFTSFSEKLFNLKTNLYFIFFRKKDLNTIYKEIDSNETKKFKLFYYNNEFLETISNNIYTNKIKNVIVNSNVYSITEYLKSGDFIGFDVNLQENTADITQGLPTISCLLEIYLPKGTNCLQMYSESNINYNNNKKIKVFLNAYEIKHLNKIHYSFFYFKNTAHTAGQLYPNYLLINFLSFFMKKYSLLNSLHMSINKVREILAEKLKEMYFIQNIDISNIHFETIVKSMLIKLTVYEEGQSIFTIGESIKYSLYHHLFFVYKKLNKLIPICLPSINGISISVLKSKPLLSRISFQDTARELTKASIKGETDWLNNVKASVILGLKANIGTNFSLKNCCTYDFFKSQLFFIKKKS